MLEFIKKLKQKFALSKLESQHVPTMDEIHEENQSLKEREAKAVKDVIK